jgi:hypothetical protein
VGLSRVKNLCNLFVIHVGSGPKVLNVVVDNIFKDRGEQMVLD